MTISSPLRLPSGNMNFALLRRHGYYYVDKTAFLRELIEPVQDPLLLTRPRRFGKTLTQTTLRSFLELNYEHPGSLSADAELFEGLAVSRDTELCAQYRSQFPVIFLTLKDLQYSTLQRAYGELCGSIAALCSEFALLGDAPQLSAFQRRSLELCQQLSEVDNAAGRRDQLLTSALLVLAQCLHAVYGRPAYILIDEYDVPLAWAAHYSSPENRSYYENMRDLVFSLLGKVVKTADPAVRRCIMTSCLRLDPPGSSSGINNLLELGMNDQRCAALMGFTQEEVDRLLSDCGLSERREEIRQWYDGYLCGSTRLYNPWSLIQYCAFIRGNPAASPRSFWIRTSSNDFRRYFISELSAESMAIMQRLLNGEAAALELRRGLDYPDPDAAEYNDQAFFTLLYQTGYLTGSESTAGQVEAERYVIPNCEVLDCFRDKVHAYFKRSAVRANPLFCGLIEALLQGMQAAAASQRVCAGQAG